MTIQRGPPTLSLPQEHAGDIATEIELMRSTPKEKAQQIDNAANFQHLRAGTVGAAVSGDKRPVDPIQPGTHPSLQRAGATACSDAASRKLLLQLLTTLIAGIFYLCTASPARAAGGDAIPTQGRGSAIDTPKGTVAAGARVTATKSVSGNFAEGGAVTYIIVLTNSGPVAQGDNAGHEFTDRVARELRLLSAAASSGTTAILLTDVVSWHGTIAPSASVTISIEAEIVASAGAWVSNQSLVVFDGDDNGTNESYTVTDDPTVPGSEDATVFVVEAWTATPIPAPASIPALGQWAQTLLLMLLGGLGLWTVVRRLQG